jgi:hypothetical protein
MVSKEGGQHELDHCGNYGGSTFQVDRLVWLSILFVLLFLIGLECSVFAHSVFALYGLAEEKLF